MKQFLSTCAAAITFAIPAYAAVPDGEMNGLLDNVRAACSEGGESDSCVAALRTALGVIVEARTVGNEVATDTQLAQLVAEVGAISNQGAMGTEMSAAVGAVILNEVSPQMQDRNAAQAMDTVALAIVSGEPSSVPTQELAQAVAVSAN
ncbi:MAG: hypothetical protein AAF771_00780 [Pseudomonadota bacterium]